MPDKNSNLWKILIGFAGALITVGAFCATVKYSVQRLDAHDVRMEKIEITAAEQGLEMRELKTDIKYIVQGIDEIKEGLRVEK
jgi:hypothetical protein